MFMSLLFKECKLILKSITYYVIAICMIGFVLFQMGEFDLRKPNPEDKTTFGYIRTNDKVVIMNEITKELQLEYTENIYNTYPIGFIKVVNLEGEDKEKVSEILEEINSDKLDINNEDNFDEFLNRMNTVSQIIGKGSKYEEDNIKRVSVQATYEQALERYNKILEEDHVSAAVARNFCDYAGIIASIMPVFLAVSVALRDRKAKSKQVIYSSRTSSISIVLARYLSVVIMFLIPIIIAAIFEDAQCIYYAKAHGIEAVYTAFFKGIFGWIMPSIMISSAVGFLFTEVFKGVWAIFIQLAWWFISMLSNKNLVGGIGLNLMPRFNTLGARDVYLSIYNELVINRLVYTFASIVLVIITIYIYNLRREGRFVFNGKIFRNSEG